MKNLFRASKHSTVRGSFNGGIGTIQGVVIGSIILQAINYALYFLGINSFVQYIIRGAIIILAVAIDVRKYVVKK